MRRLIILVAVVAVVAGGLWLAYRPVPQLIQGMADSESGSPRLQRMTHLTREQQLFVQYQIRNWVFGHYDAFKVLNAAWSAHGAEAYFWN